MILKITHVDSPKCSVATAIGITPDHREIEIFGDWVEFKLIKEKLNSGMKSVEIEVEGWQLL